MFNIGLGIDAGGTYTDAVIYDMPSQRVVSKSKALSTKWNFTFGIAEALAGLDQDLLSQVDLVALSTTLATNAIVEGRGQKVGLLLMPPAGRLDRQDIPYEPKSVLAGQLSITGREITPIDKDEVHHVARQMVEKDGVQVFAVSGYGGCINPEHEAAVKRIVQASTGLLVTCGHELSDILNFRTRAHTALLNARIIPLLDRLLADLESVLVERRIGAPVVVVRGDGTLMSSRLARQRPVETILSGPAASVAGAQFLTGLKNAVIVDMGGTTTDTAVIENGVPEICADGAAVGGFQTHVKAMHIRTEGLGGDSLIQWDKGAFTIGPTRVAPISWLAAHTSGTHQALEFLQRNINRYGSSSRNMQILTLLERPDRQRMTPSEENIVGLLAMRPYAIDELVRQTGASFAGALGLERLEQNYIIQRCGFTPTDLLHIENRFIRWSREAATTMGQMYAQICRRDLHEMTADLLTRVAEKLTLEILKSRLDEETDPADLEQSPVSRILVENMLKGGSRRFSVSIHLHHPVIGIGAPIHFFLPQAAATLGTEAVIPENADVANAVGAITSRIVIRRKIDIIAPQPGRYQVVGFAGVKSFGDLDEADAYAEALLIDRVRELAQAAGTSEIRVDIRREDRTPMAADGSSIFLGRTILGRLTGQPDLVLEEYGKRVN
ncbi:MAG: hydantoinase/oxoprolinase family protein [Desulfobacterales bacterium]|nr:MAG: hydantoinase/oxoprolinase family protein [Desulfobacterales bacterium]